MKLYEVTVTERHQAAVLHFMAPNAEDATTMAIDAFEGPTKALIAQSENGDDEAIGTTNDFNYKAVPAVVVRAVNTGHVRFVRKSEVFLVENALYVEESGHVQMVVMQLDETLVSTQEFVVLEGGKS